MTQLTDIHRVQRDRFAANFRFLRRLLTESRVESRQISAGSDLYIWLHFGSNKVCKIRRAFWAKYRIINR
jgi:hypothetical protein